MPLKTAPEGDDPKIRFMGMDVGHTDGWYELICPRCGETHRIVDRRPKACRDCRLKFEYQPSP